MKAVVKDAKPKIIHALDEITDFYVEIKWDFESWIPLVSRLFPSDLCKVYKKGTKIRIDCTLGDFSKTTVAGDSSATGSTQSPQAGFLNWQRGDLSFIFDLNKIGETNSIYFLDNKRKQFSNIDKEIEENKDNMDLDYQVSLYLSRDMFFIKSHTRNAQFIPQKVGWFSKHDRIEQCNGYLSQFFDVSNLYVVSKMRNEHLSEEDIKKNDEKEKIFRQKFQQQQQQHENSSRKNDHRKTDVESMDGFVDDIDFKSSLKPPEKSNVTWSDYINSKPGEWPILGRPLRVKASQKEFKAHLAMVNDFILA
jgi:hypothetical protein